MISALSVSCKKRAPLSKSALEAILLLEIEHVLYFESYPACFCLGRKNWLPPDRGHDLMYPKTYSCFKCFIS